MKQRILGLLTCAILAQGCGQPESSSVKIFNGTIDNQREAVGLLIKDGKRWCTATLIEKTTVLSAGHCFQGRSEIPKDLYISFDSEKIKVTKVTVHPQYSEWLGRTKNDLAILKLERASRVRPETLSRTAPELKSPVLFVGYGRVDAPQRDTHDGTRRRGSSYVEKVESKKVHFPRPEDDSMSQVCNGDSGGPIFAEGSQGLVQIGVVSGSMDKSSRKTCKVTSYAARVDAYYDWIIEQI